MQLPGRLRATTLGDLLGTLHRARASGTLELVCDRGRCHRVHVAFGLVLAVELDGAAPSLAELIRREQVIDEEVLRRSLLRAMASRRLHGEVLVTDFHLSPAIVDRALRAQLVLRLKVLEQLTDGQVHFRVTVRAPRGALTDRPLEAREFLVGRRRARDRGRTSDGRGERGRASAPAEPTAWGVLGLSPGADRAEIKRAFRRLARCYHPDLHPGASSDERRDLSLRFAEVTAAYRTLVA